MQNSIPLSGAEAGTLSQNLVSSPYWLDELGLNLARSLETIEKPDNHDPLPARLKTLGIFLKSVHRYYDEASRADKPVSYDAEWVLDNYYIIEQALRQIGENVPPEFYERLPKVKINDREMARIQVLAFALTKATDSRLDVEQIESSIQSFQTISVLKIGETWALAPMLRLSVLEVLAEALTHLTHLVLPPASPKDLLPASSDELLERHPIDNESIVVNCIHSLRMLATQDWQSFFESTNVVESILREDPSKVYGRMDFESRNRYRSHIEELARGSRADETDIAYEVVRLAKEGSCPRTRHVGYYLAGPGLPMLESRLEYRTSSKGFLRHWLLHSPTPIYLTSIVILTVLLATVAVAYAISSGGTTLQIVLSIILAILPATAVVVALVNWIVVQIVPPRILPGMDFQNGIPVEFSTMVVIPSLLKNESELGSLLRQLESHYLGNGEFNVRFALLTDFIDAPQKALPGESELIDQAKAGIEQLNERYKNDGYRPFYLFHRERIWNPAEGTWMGWERKRGKLAKLNNLIRGKPVNPFTVQVGDMSVLPTIRYVLTLDEDTTLPRDSVRRLTGILAHPLNQAEFDSETGALIAGYTVLQPRVQVKPTVANRSIFTQVYSGDTALDLYTRAVSDVYQDLFGEGNYAGKGIYDVAAFELSLQERIPENTLLSHDLFEGIHGRCGLVSNVTLFEDYPPHYLAYSDRLHRWIRGDWQLLPWLMQRMPYSRNGKNPNDLSALDRWKIFDNLRRSLLSPAVLAFIVGGWLILPGSNLVWTAMGLSTIILEVVFGILSTLRARRTDQYPETTDRPLRQAVLRSLFQIIFLPHEALISVDAISTALVRMTLTRKRLLQWVTAAHTLQLFGRNLKAHIAWREMIFAPIFAFLLIFTFTIVHPFEVWLVFPFLLGWALSPYFAVRISRPICHIPEKLSPPQERRLRLLARATWLYFEHFVGPGDHWLPPDHFQEDPRGLVAHKTSPTNIGLLLLSTLSACDLGYIGIQELSLRLRNTLDVMDQLEKQRGHFLNWYDTRTLNPLPPRYISTVDSGNLAACLITLKQGCLDIPKRPIIQWDGLIDTLEMLDETLHLAHLDSVAKELQDVIARLKERVESLQITRQISPQDLKSLFQDSRAEMEELLAGVVEASAEKLDSDTVRLLSTWIERTRHHIFQTQRDIENLCPWLLMMGQVPSSFNASDVRADVAAAWKELLTSYCMMPSLEDVPVFCAQLQEKLQDLRALLRADEQEASSWCVSLISQLDRTKSSADQLLEELRSSSERAEAYVEGMNFRSLYDPQRKVFHIGYNFDSGRLDSSYYDLLASEARIASLLAIAKGDIPQNHWLYLARPITQVGAVRALLSWSGTMFEYLMPSLLTRRYPGTLLDQSCLAAVQQQIAYGQTNHIPWGISESSFYYFDATQTYQYRAFGIPGLGFKRGLAEDLVVAPYASMLALPYTPQAVVQNLDRFQKLKAFGLYGLYESVDFTAERLGTGQNHAVVRSYMAHHQGMILLSLINYLCDRSMVYRFHADPRIDTVCLLLQEQTPVRAPIQHPHPHEIGVIHPIRLAVSLTAWNAKPDALYPRVHYLSNGTYSMLITAAGSGYSRWREVDLTRWRADTTFDNHGTWIYIQNLQTGRTWSAGSQPTASQPENQQVHFYPHFAEFLRRDGDISTRMRIVIAPDADVEIRRITLTNHNESLQNLVLTSYAEAILSPQSMDERHPAYNKLFIESEFLADGNILLYRRRPRSSDEKPVYLAHFVISERESVKITGYETDRLRFLGRGHTARDPVALQSGSSLSNKTSALDPIFALQLQVAVPGYDSHQLAFVTLAAPSRSEALALAQRFRQSPQIIKAFDDARMQAERELTLIGISSKHLERFQKLLSALLYPAAALRSDHATLAANERGQSGLWPFSISGDYPILLIFLKRNEDLDLLFELLRAHTYWRRRDLMIDLVILNCRETSYEQDLQGKIYRLLQRSNSDAWLGKRGGIFVLREDQMSEAERTLLKTAARVILDSEAGSLADQLEKLEQLPVRLPRFVPILPASSYVDSTPPLERPADLLFDNGLGGFSPDGSEYIIYLDRGQWTPAPWVNVIANPEFGFMISEAGMGCTWAVNSGENRLTPWHNDAVTDPPSEAIYLRDEDTGEIWSPTPLPARADMPYLIHHGIGYSIFEHRSHQMDQYLRIFAVTDAPVKIAQLKLKNTSSRTRRINITYYAEWVLGATHESMSQYIVPEFDSTSFGLLARNPYNQDFGQRVAFLAATRELQGLTTDRTEFFGPLGNYARPDALERVGLTASTKAGSDPCAALQLLLWLAPGESKEVNFLLGQGADRADALKLITHFQDPGNVRKAWEFVEGFWDERIGGLQIKTPDTAMDLLINRWLPYQALSSRIWGRTAFYRSGGAYGFRDQLQDVLVFLYTQPEIARAQILNAAAHQFEEGDVLHWWHPPASRGSRLRISDNLLWLPYVTAHYIHVTGDHAILDEQIPFLSDEPLKPGEHEHYGAFPSHSSGTLFEHCHRAIRKGNTCGPHGLPLIGAGDWNDGMNHIGAGGKGESVWLGWFLCKTLTDFASICGLISDTHQGDEYHQQAERLRTALEAHAWDGSWYRRAYYDDGKPVGSKENRDCQIDSISQSWAVISGAGDLERARTAMESLYERLVRPEEGLILLLTPPFDRTIRDPGYIKGYLPGVRENGGQYTHAALWAIWAFAELGQAERVYELFNLINPIRKADTLEKINRYRVEPYVIAADVYSAPAQLGHGGWTWYTGSASWMTRLVVEKILGLQREGNELRIEPCIPNHWRGYEIKYRFGSSVYHLRLENPQGVDGGVPKLTLDGKLLVDEKITLEDDGREHHINVTLAGQAAEARIKRRITQGK